MITSASLEELRKIARGLIDPPRGAVDVVAFVDDAMHYRAAWLIDGRTKHPTGPAFVRPEDAHRLIDIMRGDRR